ncbi:MAG: phospho-N-acetylmuramoyl-pentapeptide-transferase [Deltaproteobacteria bacterium]|nr:phospho-N-acetylmuramoyl-pentapeptide-transferase [Deltaproteobacteria bacterium]
MFYHFLYPLVEYHSVFNVFQYITFRTIYAAVTALVLSFIIGPYFINKLKVMQIGEVIRADGPPSHLLKAGTPTMGGAIILVAAIGSVALWGNFTNSYMWLLIFVTVAMGLIGYIDDYRKVILKNSDGLKARHKMGAQLVVAFAASIFLYQTGFDTSISIPFFKDFSIELGILYIPFAALVITGAANAVNLTDGLDGLAIGPMMIAAATYMLLAYISGHYKIADYLNIVHVVGSGELAVFAGAMVGASLGFLWYNTYPAQVFMGDIGSLSLGGGLGMLAILTKHEVLLVIVGGIFVVETLSVICQVVSFKLTGKRIFAMAPLHHHFELKGWAEPKIIVRFWIIAIILALVAISTLKLR